MAVCQGPWTKVRYDLPDDERLHAMAHRLRIDPDAVMGKLVRLWIWAGKQKGDGHVASGLSFSWVDAFSRQSGFAEAMASVGWIVKTDTGFSLPNFSEHNWKQLRSRELARDRQRLKRQRDRAVTGDVTRDVSRPGHASHTPTYTYTKEKKPCEAQGCSEPLPAASDPPPGPGPKPAKKPRKEKKPDPLDAGEIVLLFPVVASDGPWPLTDARVASLAAAFPGVDVPAECRKALAWVDANPARRKTVRGMPAFLFRWLERSNNGGRGGGAGGVPARGPSGPATGPGRAEAIRRAMEMFGPREGV